MYIESNLYSVDECEEVKENIAFTLILTGVLRGPVVARWTGDQQDGGSNLAWVSGMFHK